MAVRPMSDTEIIKVDVGNFELFLLSFFLFGLLSYIRSTKQSLPFWISTSNLICISHFPVRIALPSCPILFKIRTPTHTH
jgi:hypothetical protein